MKKKPDDKLVKLNFSADKHDAKVEEAKLSDEQRRLKPRQRQIKKKMYDIYQRWTKRVKSKARTPQEIVQATYQLQTLLGELAGEAKKCGLEDYHNFTMQICEDKIASLISTGIVSKNEIVMWVPEHPTMLDDDNDRIVREQLQRDVKPIQFRTLEELRDIPFVKAIISKDRFAGLCLHGKGLVAVFKDGETMPVGIVVNGVGLDHIPLLTDFAAALEAAADQKPVTGG